MGNIIHQLELVDIHKTLHPTRAECVFLSSARAAFSKIDHVRRQYKSQFKKIKILLSVFSNYSDMKLELVTKGKFENE